MVWWIRMPEKIVTDRKIRPGERVALLVNNLGGTPTMEMYIIARRALAFLARNIAVEHLVRQLPDGAGDGGLRSP